MYNGDVCGGVRELEYSLTVPVQAYSVRCGADPTLEGVPVVGIASLM